jgi:hypothetical protein
LPLVFGSNSPAFPVLFPPVLSFSPLRCSLIFSGFIARECQTPL